MGWAVMIVLAVSVLLAPSVAAVAAPGDLDPTFGVA